MRIGGLGFAPRFARRDGAAKLFSRVALSRCSRLMRALFLTEFTDIGVARLRMRWIESGRLRREYLFLALSLVVLGLA